VEAHGQLLGEFRGSDRILTLMDSGAWRLTGFDLSLHFDNDMSWIGKHYPDRIITAVYQEKKTGIFFIKRFLVEDSDRRVSFIEEDEAVLVAYSADFYPKLRVLYAPKGKKPAREEDIVVSDFIAVKGYKAKGKRISNDAVEKVEWLAPCAEDPDYEFLLSQRQGDEPELDEEGDIDLNFIDGGVSPSASDSGGHPAVSGDGQLELF
jgi:topoisomerase-4 subunit A